MDSSSHRLGRNAQSSVPLSVPSSSFHPTPSSSRQHPASIPRIVVQHEELDEKAEYSLPPSADAVKCLRDELEAISLHKQHHQATHPSTFRLDAVSSHTRSQQLHVPAPPSLTASPVIPSSWTAPIPSYTRPRGLRIANLLRPWIPIILYALTSLGFLVAISFWKIEVFEGLDALSHWLQSDVYIGYSVIFLLIFITTFPPVPLYSTLIILSGYTFGPWTGAIISYGASLVGALTVFIISRTFFRATISHWLSSADTVKRVVRAIEKRPKLLFLIRLAPYPYNVMNCLLAASPSLTLRTYTLCTALSLPKLIIHTSIGSSIHSFAEYHITKPSNGSQSDNTDENTLGQYSTIVGVILCVAIFIYLAYITRKAVNEELGDDEGASADEERIAFLGAEEGNSHDVEEYMIESTPYRVSLGSRPGPQREESDVLIGDLRRSSQEHAGVIGLA